MTLAARHHRPRQLPLSHPRRGPRLRLRHHPRILLPPHRRPPAHGVPQLVETPHVPFLAPLHPLKPARCLRAAVFRAADAFRRPVRCYSIRGRPRPSIPSDTLRKIRRHGKKGQNTIRERGYRPMRGGYFVRLRSNPLTQKRISAHSRQAARNRFFPFRRPNTAKKRPETTISPSRPTIRQFFIKILSQC